MTSTIKPRSPWPGKHHQGWLPCHLCSANKYNYIELKFDSGSVEPTEDETLTGATSGATGTVVGTQLISGTYTGGDAAGIVELSSPTGVDSDTLGAFTDNEAITGSTGGADMMTADGSDNEATIPGHVKTYAVLYPEEMLIEYEGKLYCPDHYRFRATPKERDKVKVNIKDIGVST